MSSETDLVAAIKEALEKDGSLNKFKAELRTKVMNVLNETGNSEVPDRPKDVLLVNELIREYLSWNGYKYTDSIFVQECGLTKNPLPRCQLLQELQVADSEQSAKAPVLFGIVSSFKDAKKTC